MDKTKTLIKQIIQAIDEHLSSTNQEYMTPPEAGKLLERKGILKDSKSRSGSPLRKILRNDGIPHAYQDGVYWIIPKSK